LKKRNTKNSELSVTELITKLSQNSLYSLSLFNILDEDTIVMKLTFEDKPIESYFYYFNISFNDKHNSNMNLDLIPNQKVMMFRSHTNMIQGNLFTLDEILLQDKKLLKKYSYSIYVVNHERLSNGTFINNKIQIKNLEIPEGVILSQGQSAFHYLEDFGQSLLLRSKYEWMSYDL
jgi:hypothetical protein